MGSCVANGQGAAGRRYTVAAIYCPTLPSPPSLQSWKSNNDSHRAGGLRYAVFVPGPSNSSNAPADLRVDCTAVGRSGMRSD